MKTNATTKTKEVELSEWILEQMREYRMDPDDYVWVAMDEDGVLHACDMEPERFRGEHCGGFWSCDGEDCLLGDLPQDLRLWPWDEFLLQWGPKPQPDTCHPTPAACLVRHSLGEGGSLTPAFQREVWAADVMSEAYRITVAIVEEPLPSPQEVPHWRLPTDEELDRLLPGGWTERCPLDL